MKISACYIAKNEERNIARSIESLRGAVDEIIVVDTGSDDRTKEIAAEMGARVLDFIWHDDFSAARNFAIEAAGGDWIVFLDADEWFVEPQGLRQALEEEMRCVPDLEAMMLLRVNLDEQGREFFRDRSLRVFRNVPWLRYHGQIHENIYSDRGKPCVSYPGGFFLCHDGYRSGVIGDKVVRNLSLMLKEIEKNGHPERFYHGLTDCYYYLRQYKKCLETAFLGLAMPTYPKDTRMELYHVALEAMRFLALPPELMCELMDCALAEFPFLPEFHAEKGILLSCRGDMKQAIDELEMAASLFEDSQQEDVFPYFYTGGGVAYERLAQVYRFLGSYDLALLNFLKSACFSGSMTGDGTKLLEEICRICGVRAEGMTRQERCPLRLTLLEESVLQEDRAASPPMLRMCLSGLIFAAAARLPQAAAELIALLPQDMQARWKGYQALKEKKEIDDADICMLDHAK